MSYSLAFLVFLRFFGGGPSFPHPGLVVDSAGRPVAAAEVTLHLPSSQFPIGRSDAQGRFLVWGPRVAGAELEARHPDFVASRLALPENPGEPCRLVLRRKAVVDGWLLDESGRPVAGARLRFRSERLLRAITTSSEDGFFVFEGLRVQTELRLEAAAAGFATSLRSFSTNDTRVSLGEWVLAEGHRLRRQVVGPSGQGVAGARIYLLDEESLESQFFEFKPQSEPNAIADDDGFFVLDGLPDRLSGPLQIRAPGYLSLQLREPWVRDIENPLRLELAPTLNGIVRDEEGKAIDGAYVVLAPADVKLPMAFGAQGKTSPEGEFSLSLTTSGLRRLIVGSFQHLPFETTLAIPERGPSYIEISLGTGFRIQGKIVAADGTSAAETSLAWRSASGTTLIETTDEDGRFDIHPLRPGPVKLLAQHRFLGEGEYDLDLAQDLTDLEFRLSPRQVGNLDLTLLDDADRPVAGFNIEIWPEALGAISRALSDPAGKARFEGLPKGSYLLRSWHEDYILVSDSLVEHEGTGMEKIVRLERTCLLTGQALGLSLSDLERTRILVEQGHSRFDGRLDSANASFRISRLRVGPLKVILRRPDSEDLERELVCERQGQVLNLTLP